MEDSAIRLSAGSASSVDNEISAAFPSTDQSVIRKVVGAAHTKFDVVQKTR